MRKELNLIMNNIAMIAADTSRSRVYVQSLVRNNLLPNFVLILENINSTVLPGQINRSNYENTKQDVKKSHDYWSETKNNLLEPIQVTLEKSSVEFKQLETTNLHDSNVIKYIKNIIVDVISIL